MKQGLIQNLSVNTIQLLINQLSGLVIFYILSTHLDKNSFGEINLVLAILFAAFSILSMGIDQLIVKKTAAGDEAQSALSLYLIHVLWTGLVFYTLLCFGYAMFSAVFKGYQLLLLLGLAKLAIYFVSPFKQVANGLERFRLLSVMSVISNLVRGAGLALLAGFNALTLKTAIIAFVAGDVAELVLGILLFTLKTRIIPLFKFDREAYRQILAMALPQAGVVIITSALARFDWIFIGLVSSTSKLAEYSFAYKVYEMSTLPLLAIAPLLIPRFTKMISQNTFQHDGAGVLIRVEMAIAAFTILMLNICWSPIIDGFTGGKYGAINQQVIFILSLSIPFVYANNFLWTMYFAQGRLKMIFHSFVLAVCVNILFDVALIPLYQNMGAAIAVLVSLMAQCIFFISKNQTPGLSRLFYSMSLSVACALAGVFAARQASPNIELQMPISAVIFLTMMISVRQISAKDSVRLSAFFGNG